MKKNLTFLGIETSCDETAASVVREKSDGTGEILSNIVSSQIEEHKEFGGVVPELAARAHVEKIEFIINKLKIIYEDTWKEKNQINTSIKLPLLVRVDHTSSNKLIEFEKILNELDLVSYHTIDKLDKKHTFYKIIFNGSSSNFINIMKNKNYLFDTQRKIWVLK